MERLPRPLDHAEDAARGPAPARGVLTLEDEIWRSLPGDRAVDKEAYDFALRSAGRPGLRVLDLGCGDGRLSGELARAGAAVRGADVSAVALERARAANPSIRFDHIAPGARLPYEDGQFEAVVCVHVLEHVADTQHLMSETRRVLSPAGTLAVAVPHHGRVQRLAIALRGFERHYDPLEPVVRFYTRRSLAGLLGAFGFESIRISAAGGTPLVRRLLCATAVRAGGLGRS